MSGLRQVRQFMWLNFFMSSIKRSQYEGQWLKQALSHQGWADVKISEVVWYWAKYPTGLVYQTFTTRCRTSQPTELSDTKCLCRQPVSVEILPTSPTSGHWNQNICCCVWILWSCTTNFITLTYTTELCHEHRHDVVKFFNVSGTFPADTVQKWWSYDATS